MNKTIWDFQQTVSQRLLRLNIVNIGLGVVLALFGKGVSRGIGTQAVGWGLINVAIAVFGSRGTRSRYDKMENPLDPAIRAREARNLRLILLVNTVLDVFYMLGGRWLAQNRGKEDERMRGTGYGIILQGALLFVFDLIHAFQVRK